MKSNSASYWELHSIKGPWDVCIIGAGIVGCSTAYHLHIKNPKLRICILDSAWPGQGASTKNAGFACFGSISELEADRNSMSLADITSILQLRYFGLQALRSILGEENLEYVESGSFEIFPDPSNFPFEFPFSSISTYSSQIPFWNSISQEAIGVSLFEENPTRWQEFNAVSMPFEGMLNPMKMMEAWHRKLIQSGIQIQYNNQYLSYSKVQSHVQVSSSFGEIQTQKLLFCTNGLSSLLPEFKHLDIKAVRNQVGIYTSQKPHGIKNPVHCGAGYWYFRPIDSHTILAGGGRYLNYRVEETAELQTTEVQLKHVDAFIQGVFPELNLQRIHQYSGILGVGDSKFPIIQEVDTNVFAGIRMGGMGVAIGTEVGKQLADLCLNSL